MHICTCIHFVWLQNPEGTVQLISKTALNINKYYLAKTFLFLISLTVFYWVNVEIVSLITFPRKSNRTVNYTKEEEISSREDYIVHVQEYYKKICSTKDMNCWRKLIFIYVTLSVGLGKIIVKKATNPYIQFALFTDRSCFLQLKSVEIRNI